QNIFACASGGPPISTQAIAATAETLATHIKAYGFAEWVREVREHHRQTYQHCLLVTGAAAAFGHHLGFNASDCRRLAMAGLLHDIGKAKIPVTILEKSGDLDEKEMAVFRQHPVLGHA